jgi:formylglycine-generating enzyme required for sulfatase activity
VAALATALAGGCGSREVVVPAPGEILLHVDTDAPLPPPQGVVLPPDAPPPLFDRLRIDVLPPGTSTPCVGCTNEFVLDADVVKGGHASVGIVPPAGASGFRARVRLFLGALVPAEGEPETAATIETTIALPPVDTQGTTDVSLVLAVDDLGVPKGTPDVPAAAVLGPPAPSVVGTWPGAARVPCTGTPRAGEACIPGGAFWLGTSDTLLDALPNHDALGPHLVVLAPFFLDLHETTVAEFRTAHVRPQIVWSGSSAGTAITDYCTYASTPGAFEALPMNCVAWDEAHAACQAKGSDLPTEAQYEYAAGHFEGRRFVWGQDEPTCSDAVFGRSGYGLFVAAEAPCRTAIPPGGVALGGSGARDRLELPTGTVLDLAGNVSEWARDAWNRHDERCWTTPGVYRDPVCERPSREPYDHAARGGEWLVLGGQLARSSRVGAIAILTTPEVGFRCARPAN